MASRLTDHSEVGSCNTHGDGEHGTTSEIQEEKPVLGREEDKWVWRLRIVTTFVLATVAVAVCLAVYFEGKHSQKSDFEQDFRDLAEKLVVSFQATVKQRNAIIESFNADLTSAAKGSLPFTTPSDWYYKAERLSGMAQLLLFAFLPRVTTDQLDAWNNYTQANSWMADFVAAEQGVSPEDLDPSLDFTVSPMLNAHYGGPPKLEDGPGPYFPFWTNYPPSGRVNINMYADVEHQQAFDETVETGCEVYEASASYTQGEEHDMRYELFKKHPYVEYRDDPFCIAFVPIFDRLGPEKAVAGVLLTVIYWRTYFEGLIPAGADGIVVVLKNTCGQLFTYEVNGLESHFVGHGDLHDTKYDYLGTRAQVSGISESSKTPTHGGCYYNIEVYASQDFEDARYDNKPLMYAIILALLFVVTVAVFFFYDFMVERRQKVVMNSAVRSGMIVSSLFPEKVRDQLYEEQDTQAKKARDEWSNPVQGTYEYKEAIAQLYEETTIFFADLAGFTSWSSCRTPQQVFLLLETLYGEFDKIAARRRVFKVETIGDCYVAATGVPSPQQGHAVIMCRFATECMEAMKVVLHSLVDTLGEDTVDLAMRVGLHSGPVTAGVLRGQKSRYQLFGDTVNTASRMESHGVKGRIHVSQATADALIARGKDWWLTPREEKIIAKGKGEMQTYFVETNKNATFTSHSSGNSDVGDDENVVEAADSFDVDEADGDIDHLTKKLHDRLGSSPISL